MPTNANAYNSRLTDEALEKRFRDTFRSQGGAELVDDLYASGVIVPVVDFTQAAEGSTLPLQLQNAWDFSTGFTQQLGAGTSTIISNSGFWKVFATFEVTLLSSGTFSSKIELYDGSTSKTIIQYSDVQANPQEVFLISQDELIVFLRAGDSLRVVNSPNFTTNVSYRQIADVSGNLTDPTGFTSS